MNNNNNKKVHTCEAQSLNDIEPGVPVVPSFDHLAMKHFRQQRTSSVYSTPLTATSVVNSRKSSQLEKTYESFQSAVFDLVVKKKVLIQAVPEILDYSSFSVRVSGNNQLLSTDEMSMTSGAKGEIFLKSYRTNILKIKPSMFKASNKSIYLYSQTSINPIKLGEVKKSKTGSKDLNIYNSEGKLIYVLEDDQSTACKTGISKFLPSSLTCATSRRKLDDSGHLRLKDPETGANISLGSYYNVQTSSNNRGEVFDTVCYEIEFPADMQDEKKMLITAILISKVPKTIKHRKLH